MNATQLLKAARAKIAKSKNWTQGTLARDSRGHAVAPWEPNAARWCAYGALQAVAGEHYYNNRIYGHALQRLPELLSVFNDASTHIAVLEAFDLAIAKENERA